MISKTGNIIRGGMMRLTDLEEAQIEYKMAKSENDYLMKKAYRLNKHDYKKLDEEEDKEKIKSLTADIQRRNKEIGLYNSRTRLSLAECLLFKATRVEVKEHCRENSLMDVFEYLDQNIFKNRQLKTNAIRRKRLIEICLNVKPDELVQAEL